jgi:general secretion pathway protein G
MPPNSLHVPLLKRLNIILEKMIRIVIWTLICLLICVILLSLSTPEFSRIQNTKTNAAIHDISNLETALDAFNSDTGRYPTTTEGLNALTTNSNLPNWKGPYIKKIPTDPWGEPYLYRYTDKPTPTCFVGSNGPDKQPKTDDDINNAPTLP